MHKIPCFLLKDKQAFEIDGLRLCGEPIALCKKLFDQGAKLIHIIDTNAIKGVNSNLDVYDKLTYFVNIEVEAAPKKEILSKLISLRSRIVISDFSNDAFAALFDYSQNKNLLVAKINCSIFNWTDSKLFDRVLDFFDEIYFSGSVSLSVLTKATKLKKRVILNQSVYKNLKNKKELKIFGLIMDS